MNFFGLIDLIDRKTMMFGFDLSSPVRSVDRHKTDEYLHIHIHIHIHVVIYYYTRYLARYTNL